MGGRDIAGLARCLFRHAHAAKPGLTNNPAMLDHVGTADPAASVKEASGPPLPTLELIAPDRSDAQ